MSVASITQYMTAETTEQTATILLLNRLSRLAYRRSNEIEGIPSLKQVHLLQYLREFGAVPQQALGQVMMCDANTLVLMLNEAEAAGHAIRRRDPDDRRRHIVELTAAGERALDEAESGMAGLEDHVLASLSAAERGRLHKLLAKALEGDRDRAAERPAVLA